MIITKLKGGLGNQMFQYAIGRHLAYKNRTELKLDISGFKSYKLRKYGLGCFNIVEDFTNNLDVKIFNFKRKLNVSSKLNKNTLYTEKVKSKFDPEVLKCKGNIYLAGYWQSEKYFKDIEDIVRQDLTLKCPLMGKNKTIAKQIDGCNSISLHVRRGDYISSPSVNEILGVCQPEYYYRAVKYITKKIRKPVFFVFSDEIGWAKKNLKLPYPVIYVDHDGSGKDYEDLALMASCKHNIIVNSTFSWWGAWLNSNKNKIVVAPRKWMVTREVDIILDNWVKL